MERFAALFVVVVLAAGCSGNGDVLDLPDEASPTSVSTASTTVPSTEAEADVGSDLAVLEQSWADLWAASGLAFDERAPALAVLGDGVSPEVAEGVPTMVFKDIVSEATTHPVFTQRLDGSVEIEDCIFYDPPIFNATAHLHTGTAEPDGEGGWVITGVLRDRMGCIPGDMAEAVLADYDEFWTARYEYWNPPDPDSPLIDATTTGDYRDAIRGLVEQDRQDGYSLVSEILGFNPELTDVLSPVRVVITDCVEVDPTGGLFDVTGERAPPTEARIAGERDLFTITMLLEGGQWKTDDVGVSIREDCQTAPTPAGLPIIG